MIEPTNYAKRRQGLRQLLGESIAFIPAAKHQTRSYDTEYRYRQSSNLKYLTGLEEQDSLLILCPMHSEFQEVLFVRNKDALMEIWQGTRLGPDKAREILEIEHVYSIDQWPEMALKLMKGHKACAFDIFEQNEINQKIIELTSQINQQKKLKEHRPAQFIHLPNLMGKLRLVKGPNEILFMKEAQKITDRAHRAAMAKTGVGVNEQEVHALFQYIYGKHGATEAYESIIASGKNACILHYINNNQTMKDGDLLLIDAGSEFHLYASDVTRTFPVNGKFTPLQKDIYEIVLAAQKESIALVRPGKTQEDVHQQTLNVLVTGLKDLGVLSESHEQIMEQGLYRRFYPHSTGHWLGLDVHDPCPYLEDDLSPVKLDAGMCITVEPGLYFQPDDPNLDERFKGIGIRIEDDILVTEKSYENLSASIPKEVAEIEEAMKKDYRDFL